MRKETKILITLLFLSPLLGELLSASLPPIAFFNPLVLSLMVLLYGCGTVLIREAKARWRLQWSVIFLASAYGIVEEGLMVKSFFNPGWVDMGVLSAYGMYLGVQWPWAIMLTIYHATMSTLIPITIVELLWPKYKDQPLLGKRGLILAFAGITLAGIFGMIIAGTQVGDEIVPYYPNPLLMVGGFIFVALLIWLAKKYSGSKISTSRTPLMPPAVFGVFGFLFMVANLLIPNMLAQAGMHGAMAILAQLVFIALLSLFAVFQIYHKDVTKRHIVALIFGSILFWIIVSPFQELNTENPDPTTGMFAVGIISFILLILWRRSVLKKR